MQRCALLSATTVLLSRLMVWFLDVNKEMRNEDDLNVVYERLDNEGQFKILQLIYMVFLT